MEFNEFKENVINWALERGIITNSTFDAQYIKLIEELGELALGIRKQDEELIKDSIGDISVVLVVLSGLKKMSEQIFVGSDEVGHFINDFQALCESIGRISLYKNNREGLKHIITYCLTLLKKIAKEQEMDFNECLGYAWNEIKDRKGYLREDGIFIKEEDYKNKGV